MTEGLVYCGELKFDMGSGMEVNEEREWGPDFEKTNSYLKELLDIHKAMRKHKRAVVAAAEALNAANEDET